MTPGPPRSRRRLLSALLAGACVVITAVTTVLALRGASGVTALGGGEFETEFIDGGLYAWAWLTLIGLAVAAWLWAVPALIGLGAVVAVTAAGMVVAVRRYADAGWGDGLEYLGFLMPIGLLVLGSVLVATAVALRRRRRRRPAPRVAPA